MKYTNPYSAPWKCMKLGLKYTYLNTSEKKDAKIKKNK